MRSSLVLVFAAAGATAILAQACGDEPPPPEPVIRPVRTLQVFATGAGQERTFPGTAQAALESRLSFKVTGTVKRVAVAVGDRVRSGQVLAAIDDRDLSLQVQEAEARLASAAAQARNAQANHARVRALYENRNASLNDLDAARAAAESAQQNVNSVAKRLELARATLGYAELRAPVDGAIAEVLVEASENVTPGQPVLTLTAGSQLEVQVAVPGMLIAQVREGDAATVRFDALAGRVLTARVTEVGVGATGMATIFPVLLLLDHPDLDCRPGMAAEVTLRFGDDSGRERLFVPAVAVAEDRQGRYVWIVEAGAEGFGSVHRQAVTVGELSGAGLEVLEGLQDGDLVVTAGVSRIVAGQKVRLL